MGRYGQTQRRLKAAAEWPVLLDRKQLQQFLRLVTFYRRFIKDYSQVAAPLIQLIFTLISFSWTSFFSSRLHILSLSPSFFPPIRPPNFWYFTCFVSMEFVLILFPTEDYNSSPKFGRSGLGGASSNLNYRYHLQSNGQSERFNQELEAVLRCFINNNPTSCCQHLSWVEYTHNYFTFLSAILSLLKVSFSYSLPLFSNQEADISVPSVQHHFHRYLRICNQTKEYLLHTVGQNSRFAYRHRPAAPNYQVGQRVWLSTKYSTSHLHNFPRK